VRLTERRQRDPIHRQARSRRESRPATGGSQAAKPGGYRREAGREEPQANCEPIMRFYPIERGRYFREEDIALAYLKFYEGVFPSLQGEP